MTLRTAVLLSAAWKTLTLWAFIPGTALLPLPARPLTEEEYHNLRYAALKIIRALGIEGGCNIQFALSLQYGLLCN